MLIREQPISSSFQKIPNSQRLKPEMKQGGEINLSERTSINSEFSSGQDRNWVPRLSQPGTGFLNLIWVMQYLSVVKD